MKLSKLIPAACLASLGIASGQGLYSIMPYDDEPVEGLPLHWTAALNVGYDDNPAPILSDCPGFDTDGAMYVSASIQGNLVLKSAQSTVDGWVRLGVTHYLDDVQQQNALGLDVGSSESEFYTVQAGLNVVHHVNERLRFRSRNNIAYEQEPDYDSGIATDRRQGQYLRYSSDNSLGYRWTERLGTVTGIRINGTTWDDISSADSQSILIYNQFRYRTTERTVLTGSIRYGMSDNDGGNDSDSLYLLVGAEHEFSENTVGVLRIGAQHYDPDTGSSQWAPYIEGTIKTQINEQFGLRAFIFYGLEGRNRALWIHDCADIGSIPDDTALAFYNERAILRIGTQGSYVVSEALTVFGGVNLIFEDYQDGVWLKAPADAMGAGPSDFEESIFNINLGASLQVSENVFVTGSYNYSDSSSDSDIREYDRHRVQVGVQTSF